MSAREKALGTALLALMASIALAAPPSADAASSTLVISQVYTGAGSLQAQPNYRYAYIEVFNRGSRSVSLSGRSIQVTNRSSATFAAGALPNVTLAVGKHFLIRENSDFDPGPIGVEPTADVNGSFSLDPEGGRIALVNSTIALRCGLKCVRDPWVMDFIGYGSATEGEGGHVASAPNEQVSLARKNAHCTDTDDNIADINLETFPSFRSSTAAAAPCAAPPTTFPQTLLVSRADPDGVGGDKPSGTTPVASAVTLADLTPNGQFATFNTSALNLRPPGTNATTEPWDVMVRDLDSGVNDVISIPNGPAPNPLAAPLGHGTASDGTAVSASRIAFVDDSPDLLTGALAKRRRVWVRDRATGVTQLASQIDGASGTDSSVDAHGEAWAPSISADGRYVAFVSTGDNLVPGDFSSTADIYVRDLQTNTTRYVSGANNASQGGNGPSDEPMISADGQWVVFSTQATDIGTCAPSGAGAKVIVRAEAQGFSRDTVSRGTAQGAAGSNDQCANGSAETPVISADGSRVAFVSHASSLGGNPGTATDVFVRDIKAGTTTLVDTPDGPIPASGPTVNNGENFDPTISPDGNSVSFVSTANSLGPDANSRSDIFVRDLNQATTTIASVPDGPTPGPGGTFGDAGARRPLGVTNDGKTTTFTSAARNLAPGENPSTAFDVFARTSVSAVPLVSTQPTVTGDPRVTKSVTCNIGKWTRTPVTFTRQWRRNTTDLGGQTGKTYSPVAADKDQSISCRVNASNAAGSGVAATSAGVTILAGTPNNITPPTVSGIPKPDSALHCTPGTWNEGTLTHRWVRSVGGGQFVAINNQTALDYTVTDDDIGSRVACQELATNGAGTEISQSNFKTAAPGAPEILTAPGITGTPVEGQSLSCNDGLWSNNAMTYTRRWLRDGTAIPGATGANYTVVHTDSDKKVTCEVTATNDVATSAPAPSAGVFAVSEIPVPGVFPHLNVIDKPNKKRATDRQLFCSGGSWAHDPGPDTHGYRIERAAGGVLTQGQTWDITVDDLGHQYMCVETVTNAKGSNEAASPLATVPLPELNDSAGTPVFKVAGGFNTLDPVNMVATTEGFAAQLAPAQLERVNKAYEDFVLSCATKRVPPGLPAKQPGRELDEAKRTIATCQLLLHSPVEQIKILPDGVHVVANPLKCIYGADDPCAALPIPMPQAAPSNAGISPDLVPERVLWDLDGNGTTDLSCPGTAPIARTIYNRGWYRVRAVLVLPGSAETGIYPSVTQYIDHHALPNVTPPPTPVYVPKPPNAADLDLGGLDLVIPAFNKGGSTTTGNGPQAGQQLGKLRKAQPAWCWNTLEPPDIPEQPCLSEGNIGAVHVIGNICPVSLRRIPDDDLAALERTDPELYQILVAQNDAIGAARARERRLQKGGRSPIVIPDTDYGVQDYVLQQYASVYPDTTDVSKKVAVVLKDQNIDTDKAGIVLDQVNVVRGNAIVDGIKIEAPRTLLIPSDVGEAVTQIKKMRVFSSSAIPVIGKIPLGKPDEVFNHVVNDAIDAGAQELIDRVDFDALAAQAKSLADDLNLGPFHMAGEAKVKLENGAAIIDAQAKLPIMNNARANVRLRFTPDGVVQFEGIKLNVGNAKIGAVDLKDVVVEYDGTNGLLIKGKVTFPWAGGAGIEIVEFRLGPKGDFQALILNYLAGAGQGITVGPGVFLTKLGGGLSRTATEEKIEANAAVSVGPSAGGGCPTVGADGSMKVHFGPDKPFYVQANVNMQLVCLGLANVNFKVDSTGYAKLIASMGFEGGPLFFNATLNGALRIPNWQVDLDAHGGIHLPDPLPDIEGGFAALISNRGLAGCGSVLGFEGGAGVHWNPALLLGPAAIIANVRLFTGCDFADFRSITTAGVRTAQATGAKTFNVAAGERALVLSVEGLGAAPRAVLHGPDGTTVDLTGEAAGVNTDRTLGARVEDEDRDVFIVKQPKAGNWSVTPAADSAQIVRLQRSQVLPPPKVRAKVVRAGSYYKLRWSVARHAGQVVRFVEQAPRGNQTLVTVNGGGKGVKKFIPVESTGPARTIEAQVEQDKMPRANVAAAKFSAPSPRVGRPGRVRIHRKGKGAIVTWKKAFLAARYEIVATTSSGARTLFLAGAKKRKVAIKMLRAKDGATITVNGVSASGRMGRAAKGKLAKPKPKHKPKKKKHKRKHH